MPGSLVGSAGSAAAAAPRDVTGCVSSSVFGRDFEMGRICGTFGAPGRSTANGAVRTSGAEGVKREARGVGRGADGSVVSAGAGGYEVGTAGGS